VSRGLPKSLFLPSKSCGSVNNRRYGTYRYSEWLVINLLIHRLSNAKSKIILQFEYGLSGFVDNVEDVLGMMSLRMQGDLE
jgi:hypothetical protein